MEVVYSHLDRGRFDPDTEARPFFHSNQAYRHEMRENSGSTSQMVKVLIPEHDWRYEALNVHNVSAQIGEALGLAFFECS